MIILELTEKEAAAVHAVYSVGIDLLYAKLEPRTIDGCAGILKQFKLPEVHAMRDKITKLADEISDETLEELGVKRINT